jgi:cystathionine gamma-synthase
MAVSGTAHGHGDGCNCNDVAGHGSPGMHIVITADSYRKTRVFVRDFLRIRRQAHQLRANGRGIASAIRPNSGDRHGKPDESISGASISSPGETGQEKRIKTLIDAFGDPLQLQPLAFGVDLVVHSATKYLGGHNDLMAGAVIGNRGLIDAIREYQGMFGALASPFTAYMLIRGLKTLPYGCAIKTKAASALPNSLKAIPRLNRFGIPA